MRWSLSRLGDGALVLAFEERIDPIVNSHVVHAAAAIREAACGGVRDVVASYTAVTVHFDPLRTDLESLAARMKRIAEEVPSDRDGPGAASRTVEIPVCYGGAHGPDLPAVARFGGCSEAAVVARHAAPAYRVYMLGFLPGFAYLASVDPTIAAPRRETPRLRVPAGSVGIAGGQTGVYPLEAPGGWQLIGRTPRRVYDPDRAEPFLLRAGDAVRFVPIGEVDYRAQAGHARTPPR